MAAQGQSADEAQSTTVEKSVTIIGYAPSADGDSRRFAGRVDPESRDFTEREESERESHYVKHFNDEENEYQEEYISESTYEVLMNSPAFDPSNDDSVTLKRKVDAKVQHTHSLDQAVESLLLELFDDLEVPEGLFARDLKPALVDEGTWADRVTFNGIGMNEQNVLVHQSERSNENRFETDEKHPALQFTVNLQGPEEFVEENSESIVSHFMEGVAGVDGVGKVRASDCTERVEKEGDCFDAL